MNLNIATAENVVVVEDEYSNIVINGDVVTLDINGKSYEYDLDQGTITLGENVAVITTTVEYISSSCTMTEVELLELG